MNKKKQEKQNLGQVIIPTGTSRPPESHEVETAWILAQHYQTTVEFIVPVDDYKRKSADIRMLDVEWELKCPTGASKTTIEKHFRKASKQARNIVIDICRTPLEYESVEKIVLFELKNRPSMKKVRKVVIINKFKKVIEITK